MSKNLNDFKVGGYAKAKQSFFGNRGCIEKGKIYKIRKLMATTGGDGLSFEGQPEDVWWGLKRGAWFEPVNESDRVAQILSKYE